MNTETVKHKMQTAVPAALFIALEGLYAAPLLAGEGVVIMQRNVPIHSVTRGPVAGRATTIDVSPDDKVNQSVGGQQAGLQSIELDDQAFAAVSTNTPQAMGNDAGANGIYGLSALELSGFNGVGNNMSPATSIAGTVGGAVSGATGHIAGSISGATGALSGLAGAVMRSSGQ